MSPNCAAFWRCHAVQAPPWKRPGSAVPEPVFRMPNEAILVVDDAPVNLKLTGILLRKEGYDVHSAVDAEQALDLLETFHPDLMQIGRAHV